MSVRSSSSWGLAREEEPDMRLKYYLRGAGIGVIVATLILMIAFSVTSRREEAPEEPGTEEELTIEEALSAREEDSETEEPLAAIDTEMAELPADTEMEEEPESEVIEEASELPEETGEETEPEENSGEEDKELPEELPKKLYTIEVVRGDSPGAVAAKLARAGAIDDEDAFYRYLVDNGLNDLLEVGTFSIPEGAEFSEIAELLTTNEYERRKQAN